MAGRYGSDQLNVAILAVYIILNLITMLLPGTIRRNPVLNLIMMILAYAMIIVIFYRMFSRNVTKRYQENQKFLHIFSRFRGKWQIRMKHLRERKDYHFYTCKSCGQKIRVPKGKGRICITCPKCRNEFIKNS